MRRACRSYRDNPAAGPRPVHRRPARSRCRGCRDRALVGHGRHRRRLRTGSPLRSAPGLAPLTWALQALARSSVRPGSPRPALDGGRRWPAWWRSRAAALLPAVGSLVVFWAALFGVLLLAGYAWGRCAPSESWWSARCGSWPSWPSCGAAWPLLSWLDRSLRGYAVLIPVAVVLLHDLGRYGGGVPVSGVAATVSGVAAAALCAWAVPYLVGIRLARGAVPVEPGAAVAGALAVAAVQLGSSSWSAARRAAEHAAPHGHHLGRLVAGAGSRRPAGRRGLGVAEDGLVPAVPRRTGRPALAPSTVTSGRWIVTFRDSLREIRRRVARRGRPREPDHGVGHRHGEDRGATAGAGRSDRAAPTAAGRG